MTKRHTNDRLIGLIGLISGFIVVGGLLSLWWWYLLATIWGMVIPVAVFIPAGILMIFLLPVALRALTIAAAIVLQLYLWFLL